MPVNVENILKVVGAIENSIIPERKYLGIDKFTETELFYNFYVFDDLGEVLGIAGRYRRVNSKDAVKVLRHLAETGEVDWGICK